MKEKGFTLIELLAVIVILAIITLIATPIILNIINDSKKSAKNISVQNYIAALEQAIIRKKIKGEFNPNECEIYNGEVFCDGKKLEVEADGDVPTSGKLYLDKGMIKEGSYLVDGKEVFFLNENKEVEKKEIPEPKSFAEDSWETIALNVRTGNLSKYNIGDKKEVELDGLTNTESNSNGLYTIRIANTLTPEECKKEEFSQTACGFVIEFEDIITKHNMNPDGEYKGIQYSSGWNVDGYPASSMYAYVKNDIFNILPKELQKVIINTKVVSGHGSVEIVNFETIDKLYLLSPKEIWGSNPGEIDTSANLTRQLDYYANKKVTLSSYLSATKKYNGKEHEWWLRSAISNSTDYFYSVKEDGDWDGYNPIGLSGVVVAFRIG